MDRVVKLAYGLVTFWVVCVGSWFALIVVRSLYECDLHKFPEGASPLAPFFLETEGIVSLAYGSALFVILVAIGSVIRGPTRFRWSNAFPKVFLVPAAICVFISIYLFLFVPTKASLCIGI
jgi:hypothetical protein